MLLVSINQAFGSIARTGRSTDDFGLIAYLTYAFRDRSGVQRRCFKQHLDALVAPLGPNLSHARQGLERVFDAPLAPFTDQSLVTDDLERNGLKHGQNLQLMCRLRERSA